MDSKAGKTVCTLFASVPRNLWAAIGKQAEALGLGSPEEATRQALSSYVAHALPAERIPPQTEVMVLDVRQLAAEVSADEEPAQTIIDQPNLERLTIFVSIPEEDHEGLRGIALNRKQPLLEIILEALREWLRPYGEIPPEEL